MKYNVDRRIYTDRWRKPGDIALYTKQSAKKCMCPKKQQFASEKTYPTSRFVQKRNELKDILPATVIPTSFRHDFVKKIRSLKGFCCGSMQTTFHLFQASTLSGKPPILSPERSISP